jgi:hypothetical protein
MVDIQLCESRWVINGLAKWLVSDVTEVREWTEGLESEEEEVLNLTENKGKVEI